MICNAQGIALIKRFESCRLQAYLDAVGIPTIGWGHTGPEVHLGLTWTQAQADGTFLSDLLHKAEIPLNSMLAGIVLTSNMYSALCSLVFNIGAGAFRGSTMLTIIHSGVGGNSQWVEQAAEQFPRWDKAGGEELPGLLARREAEAQLWNQA